MCGADRWVKGGRCERRGQITDVSRVCGQENEWVSALCHTMLTREFRDCVRCSVVKVQIVPPLRFVHDLPCPEARLVGEGLDEWREGVVDEAAE